MPNGSIPPPPAGFTLDPPSSGSSGPRPELLDSMIFHESAGNPRAVSSKGARGLMQVMPDTGKMYGVHPDQLFDPNINRQVGTRYFGDLLNRYHGNEFLALVAYNGGPHRVDRGQLLPESVQYANNVLSRAHGGGQEPGILSRIGSAIGGDFEGTAEASDIPPPPPGYTLDQEHPPPGFTLDKPSRQGFGYDPAQAEQVEPGVTTGLQPSMIQPADLLTFGLAGGAEAAGKTALEEGTGLLAPQALRAGLRAGLGQVPAGLGVSAASQSVLSPLTSMIPTDTSLGTLARGTAEQAAGMLPFVTGGEAPGFASGAWNRVKGATPVAAEAMKATGEQEARNVAAQEKIAKEVTGEYGSKTAGEKFADVKAAADRKLAEHGQRLQQSAVQEVLPEAKQAAIGQAPSPTMAQGPGRLARNQQFREAALRPLKDWRANWGEQRNDLLTEYMADTPDPSTVRETIANELARWVPSGQRPYGSAAAGLLHEAAHLGEAKIPSDMELLKAAGYEPDEIQAMFAPRMAGRPTVVRGEMRQPASPTAGQPNISVGEVVLNQLRQAWEAQPHPETHPKVSDFLTLQAKAKQLAITAQGADQTAAKIVSRSIDDALAGFVPTPELKALNAKYWDHRLHFPYEFEDAIEGAMRPLDAAKAIFDRPERALDLAQLGGPDTKQAMRELYAQWVGENGAKVIDPSHAAFMKEIAPNTPYADPKSWVYEQKAQDHLVNVINSSPQVKAKWEGLVQKNGQKIIDGYNRHLATFAFKDAPRFGPAGERLLARLRATKDLAQQQKLIADFYSKVTPEAVTSELAATQKTPEEAGIEAIQERGYKPTPLTGTMKRRLLWTVPGGLGGLFAFGHPSGYALGAMALDAPIGLRERLVRSFQESLRNPVEARRFYQAITNPSTPAHLDFLAGEAAKAGVASAAERAGYDMSLPEPHSVEGPGMKVLGQARAEAVAPALSASDRAVKVAKQLSKGKQPDVHRDLSGGRLSLDETNKLIQQASTADPSTIVQGMPIEEVLNAAEVASLEEKQMLMPMILQRLKAELPKQKNMTLANNLAQRFKRLQMMPAQREV